MITYVAKVINLFATTVNSLIQLASFIGEQIISSVLWIFTFIMRLSQNIVNFFHIVYEDNASMFNELPDSANNFVDSLTGNLYFIIDLLEALYYGLCNKIAAVISSTLWLANTLFTIVSEFVLLLLNTVIFMGETIWLVITFVPIQLPIILRTANKYMFNIICDGILSGYMKLLKFTNYLTEVPLESFMGIISAIVIVRLCVHFKESIITNITNLYWSLIRNLLYVYHVFYNYFTNPDVHAITRMATGDVLSASETSDVNSNDVNGADALCVICQERQKTVLTLPCRHICLCGECCRRLYGYQRTCPICRTFIYHSVTVYW